MKKIVIIDDKDHAIKQIQFNFPKDKINNYEIKHYESFKEFSESEKDRIYIIFLDFFLDKDRKPGTEFIDKLTSDYFIGFSSMIETTTGLAEKAKMIGKWNENKIFGIRKIKETLENKELRELLKKIIV